MASNHKIEIERAYNKKVLGLLNRLVVETAIQIDRDLVRETPVDTGRARANWLPSIGRPRSEVVPPSNTESVEEIQGSYKVGQTIYITNNLPYIQRLNEGHSGQAPSGFIDLIVQRAKKDIKKKAKRAT